MKTINQLENAVLMDSTSGEELTPLVFGLMNQANQTLTNLYILYVGPKPTAGKYEYVKDGKTVTTYSLNATCLAALKLVLL